MPRTVGTARRAVRFPGSRSAERGRTIYEIGSM
jgi:hypothetical protein